MFHVFHDGHLLSQSLYYSIALSATGEAPIFQG